MSCAIYIDGSKNTDANCDMICRVWMNRDEIATHDSDIVMINGENESGINRSVDQSE